VPVSQTDPPETEDLDPAMERVRRKLTRLLMVSSGVMALGFAAVLVAVIYRIQADAGQAAAPEPVSTDLPLALGDIRSVTVAEDRLVLTIHGEAPRIEVRRLSDGALVNTLRLAGDGGAE